MVLDLLDAVTGLRAATYWAHDWVGGGLSMPATSIVDYILPSVSVTGTKTTHSGLQSISGLVSFGSTFASFSATGAATNAAMLYPSKL